MDNESNRKMIELPPMAFRYGNYNADIPFEVFINKKKFLDWLKDQTIIGYCKNPEFKSRAGYVAVAFDFGDGGEYWSHVPIKIFEKFKKGTENGRS